MLQIGLITDNPAVYGQYLGSLSGSLYLIDEMCIEIINRKLHDIEVDAPLIVPVGPYGYDTYESKSISEAYKRLISNIKYVINRGNR